jgi:hypothetical protein
MKSRSKCYNQLQPEDHQTLSSLKRLKAKLVNGADYSAVSQGGLPLNSRFPRNYIIPHTWLKGK